MYTTATTNIPLADTKIIGTISAPKNIFVTMSEMKKGLSHEAIAYLTNYHEENINMMGGGGVMGGRSSDNRSVVTKEEKNEEGDDGGGDSNGNTLSTFNNKEIPVFHHHHSNMSRNPMARNNNHAHNVSSINSKYTTIPRRLRHTVRSKVDTFGLHSLNSVN